MMKVLEVNLERGWRGGERQTLWTAEALGKLGVEVTVMARRGEALAKAAHLSRLPVVEVSGNAEACRWLWRRGRRYDIIHAQTAHALTACVASAWGHRRPVVATRRVAFPPRGAATRFKYARCDALVAISGAAAAPLEALGLGPILRIPSAVRRETVEPEAVEALRRAWVPAGKRVLGTVAALTPEKDPRTLVAAVRALRQQRNDFVFVHLGSGALQAEIESAIRDAALEGTYRLAGFQDPVAPWYELFDGFVMSSRSEGLGSSVLDAMLRKIPVAVTLAGGLVEVVANGRGLGVTVGDAEGLARAMNELLDESPTTIAQRDKRVAHAFAWVQAECSVDAMAARYLALFQSLMR